jgi:sugar phosphate isomerase/epimerase
VEADAGGVWRWCCSNLAWSADEDAQAEAWLAKHGIVGIEVAPTRLWPDWCGATLPSARAWASRWRAQGFTVPALQAILFGVPNAMLFGPDNGAALESHLGTVSKLAAGLGAPVCVFGAPRQRARGAMDLARALDLARPLFLRLARRFHDAGIVLALEPARPEYGGDFLVDTCEVVRFVREVGHPGLGVQLDSAALHSAGESVSSFLADPAVRPWLAHFHISQPGLRGYRDSLLPHADNLRELRLAGWDRVCSFELLRSQAGPLHDSGLVELMSQQPA